MDSRGTASKQMPHVSRLDCSACSRTDSTCGVPHISQRVDVIGCSNVHIEHEYIIAEAAGTAGATAGPRYGDRTGDEPECDSEEAAEEGAEEEEEAVDAVWEAMLKLLRTGGGKRS